METQNHFVLNDVFKQNAKIYQSRPVKAAKYQPGMESAWMLYFSNWNIRKKDIPIYEGVKFFPTESNARAYIEANKKQYMMLDGNLVESDVEYDLIKPVLLRKVVDAENRIGINFEFGDNTFIADESKDYEFYILEADTWIILDTDGTIRVWDRGFLDLFGATFFGCVEDIVYEKVSEDKYIKVAV